MRVNTAPYIVVFDSGSGFGIRGPRDFVEFGHRKFEHAQDRAIALRRQRLWMAADGIAGNEEDIDNEKGEWHENLDVNSPGNPGNQTIPETEAGEIVEGDHEDDDDPLMHGGGTNGGPKGAGVGKSIGKHMYGESPDSKNKVSQADPDANFGGGVEPNKSKAISVPSGENESNATHVKSPNEGKDPFKELPKRGAASDGETHQAFRQVNQHSMKSEPHHTQPVPYMAGQNPNHPMSPHAGTTLSANTHAAFQQTGRMHAGMATDPPVSREQQQAMCAAAHGHSTLGIPKHVGEEFCGPIGGGKDKFTDFLKAKGMDDATIMDACGMVPRFGGKDCHY